MSSSTRPAPLRRRRSRCAASRTAPTAPTWARIDQAGDVAINNLTISGAYGQDVIAFYRIAGFDSFTGSNNSVNVTRSVNANANATLEPWAVINMDEVGGRRRCHRRRTGRRRRHLRRRHRQQHRQLPVGDELRHHRPQCHRPLRRTGKRWGHNRRPSHGGLARPAHAGGQGGRRRHRHRRADQHPERHRRRWQ